MADRPIHRLISKNEGDERWVELASAWRSAAGKITVTFSKDVPAGTRALWVDVKPKDADRPAQAQRRDRGQEPGR